MEAKLTKLLKIKQPKPGKVLKKDKVHFFILYFQKLNGPSWHLSENFDWKMGQVDMAHTKFDLKMGQVDLAHYSISLNPNLKWANLTWPIIKFLTFLMMGQVDLAHAFFCHLLQIFWFTFGIQG